MGLKFTFNNSLQNNALDAKSKNFDAGASLSDEAVELNVMPAGELAAKIKESMDSVGTVDSETKRKARSILATFVICAEEIKEAIEKFSQAQAKQEEIEQAVIEAEYNEQFTSTGTTNTTTTTTATNERAKQLEELRQLESKIKREVKIYAALQQRLEVLTYIAPAVEEFSEYAERSLQESQKNFAGITRRVNERMPSWQDDKEFSQDLSEAMQRIQNSTERVLQAQVLYTNSLAKHAKTQNSNANLPERSAYQMALQVNMHEELFLTTALLKKLNKAEEKRLKDDPKAKPLTGAEKMKIVKGFLGEYFKDGLSLTLRASDLEIIFKNNKEKIAAAAKQLNKERGISYLSTMQNNVEDATNKLKTQRAILFALFDQHNEKLNNKNKPSANNNSPAQSNAKRTNAAVFADLNNNSQIESRKVMETKANAAHVLKITALIMQNPSNRYAILKKYHQEHPGVPIKGFDKWASNVIKDYRAMSGIKYQKPDKDAGQDALSRAERFYEVAVKNTFYITTWKTRAQKEEKQHRTPSLNTSTSTATDDAGTYSNQKNSRPSPSMSRTNK